MRFCTLASRAIASAVLVLVMALSAACGAAATPTASVQTPSAQAATAQPSKPAPATDKAGIANPASTNCIDKGGRLEIVKGQAGEVGMCLLPDGTTCEEWALFRGECKAGDKQSQIANPASEFCVDNGGKSEIVDAGKSGEWGKCAFKDGSFCDEWSYFRGACKPGDQKP